MKFWYLLLSLFLVLYYCDLVLGGDDSDDDVQLVKRSVKAAPEVVSLQTRSPKKGKKKKGKRKGRKGKK